MAIFLDAPGDDIEKEIIRYGSIRGDLRNIPRLVRIEDIMEARQAVKDILQMLGIGLGLITASMVILFILVWVGTRK